MRTKDCEPLAKAISGITDADQRKIAKAAVIRLLQPNNPLFDPDVFGKHVEDHRKKVKPGNTKDELWKGIDLLRAGRDLLQKIATPIGDGEIIKSVDDLDGEISFLVRYVWNRYKK